MQDTSDRVKVAFFVVSYKLSRFWATPLSYTVGTFQFRLARKVVCGVEINQFEMEGGSQSHHDVVGFDVAVNYSVRVKEFYGRKQLVRDLLHFFESNLA